MSAEVLYHGQQRGSADFNIVALVFNIVDTLEKLN